MKGEMITADTWRQHAYHGIHAYLNVHLEESHIDSLALKAITIHTHKINKKLDCYKS